MKAFHCDQCGSLVFFENVLCVRCNHALGFLPDLIDLSTLEPRAMEILASASPAAHGASYKQCANGQQHQVCNWLVPVEDTDSFCVACRLNDVIPDLTVRTIASFGTNSKSPNAESFTRCSALAFHRRLPRENRPPLRFRFMSDPAGGPPVMTGHDRRRHHDQCCGGGRPGARAAPGRFARTFPHVARALASRDCSLLLGRTRVGNTPHLGRFRELFGDETQDYAASLQNYYQQGAPADWQTRLVSAYATAHPWEDWAETSAHYFHIVDTVGNRGQLRPGAEARSIPMRKP